VKIKLAYLARREPEQARQAAFRWCIRDAAGRFPHHQASHAGSVPRGARKREYSTVGQGGLCRFLSAESSCAASPPDNHAATGKTLSPSPIASEDVGGPGHPSAAARIEPCCER